jgi:hypothetical protein
MKDCILRRKMNTKQIIMFGAGASIPTLVGAMPWSYSQVARVVSSCVSDGILRKQTCDNVRHTYYISRDLLDKLID